MTDWVLVPQNYEMPTWLSRLTEGDNQWTNDERTFEQAANPDDVGACAAHIDFQEPLTLVRYMY